jgi:hypothetical protein
VEREPEARRGLLLADQRPRAPRLLERLAQRRLRLFDRAARQARLAELGAHARALALVRDAHRARELDLTGLHGARIAVYARPRDAQRHLERGRHACGEHAIEPRGVHRARPDALEDRVDPEEQPRGVVDDLAGRALAPLELPRAREPVVHAEEVVELRMQPPERAAGAVRADLGERSPRACREVRRDADLRARIARLLGRVLADGLEEAQALIGSTRDERLVAERLEHVERARLAHRCGTRRDRVLGRERATKGRERREERALVVREQRVRPRDGAAQRGLSLAGVASTVGEQIERLLRAADGEPRGDVVQTEERDAARRELERERDPIEAPHERREPRGVAFARREPRAARDQAHRVAREHLAGARALRRNRERRHEQDRLALDAQRLSRGDDDAGARDGDPSADEPRDVVDALLGVVEHDERTRRGERARGEQAIERRREAHSIGVLVGLARERRPQARGERAQHRERVARGREIDEEAALPSAARAEERARERGLAGTRRADERHDLAIFHSAAQRGELARATDETSGCSLHRRALAGRSSRSFGHGRERTPRPLDRWGVTAAGGRARDR